MCPCVRAASLLPLLLEIHQRACGSRTACILSATVSPPTPLLLTTETRGTPSSINVHTSLCAAYKHDYKHEDVSGVMSLLCCSHTLTFSHGSVGGKVMCKVPAGDLARLRGVVRATRPPDPRHPQQPRQWDEDAGTQSSPAPATTRQHINHSLVSFHKYTVIHQYQVASLPLSLIEI